MQSDIHGYARCGTRVRYAALVELGLMMKPEGLAVETHVAPSMFGSAQFWVAIVRHWSI